MTNETFEDKKLVCENRDQNPNCEGEFDFTAGEQEFYKEKGFSEPKNCKSCRDARKRNRNRNRQNNDFFNSDTE